MVSAKSVINWNTSAIPQEATLRAAGVIFNGGFVEEIDERPVWRSVAEVFPPVGHQDRQGVRFHAVKDGVEDFMPRPVAGKKTAGM